MTEAYFAGFNKTAEAYGINPNSLIKVSLDLNDPATRRILAGIIGGAGLGGIGAFAVSDKKKRFRNTLLGMLAGGAFGGVAGHGLNKYRELQGQFSRSKSESTKEKADLIGKLTALTDKLTKLTNDKKRLGKQLKDTKSQLASTRSSLDAANAAVSEAQNARNAIQQELDSAASPRVRAIIAKLVKDNMKGVDVSEGAASGIGKMLDAQDAFADKIMAGVSGLPVKSKPAKPLSSVFTSGGDEQAYWNRQLDLSDKENTDLLEAVRMPLFSRGK